MVRRSTPASRRWVAKQWRRTWMLPSLWMPARALAWLKTARPLSLLEGAPGQRLGGRPGVRVEGPPVGAQFLQEARGEQGVAVALPFALDDANHHALAVDVGGPE